MDLRNGEVAVDVAANESTMGPSGRRKRSSDSVYLTVGGSRDNYDVTVNFETGHFCKNHAGNCKGNMHGKGQKFGPINRRDTTDSQQWCKHVQAALADTQALAEAREITDRAFGFAPAPVVAEPTPEPTPEPIAEPLTAQGEARKRLADLEREREALLAEIAAEEKAGELRQAVAALIEEHGAEAVRKAVAA